MWGLEHFLPSTKKSQGAEAGRCWTKRTRLGSIPALRIAHSVSHNRSGL